MRVLRSFALPLLLLFPSHACSKPVCKIGDEVSGCTCPAGTDDGCGGEEGTCAPCIHIYCPAPEFDCDLDYNPDDDAQPFLDCVCRNDVCGQACADVCNHEGLTTEECEVCATKASTEQCKNVPCLPCY